MSLSFKSRKGTVEQRWIYYAMLRDNVQHHLEGGAPGGDFEALHAVGSALTLGRVAVPAGRLHDELVVARGALAAKPMHEFAVSLRTQAVVSLKWPPPERRETTVVGAHGSAGLPTDASMTTLGDAFGHLLDALIDLSEGAQETDVIEVVDL